jgi:hypothetical protein
MLRILHNKRKRIMIEIKFSQEELNAHMQLTDFALKGSGLAAFDVASYFIAKFRAATAPQSIAPMPIPQDPEPVVAEESVGDPIESAVS